MHIHILQVRSRNSGRANKDTNGGFGTVNDFGRSIPVWILKTLKNLTMNFPEMQPAYIYSILKNQGHTLTYSENALDPHADIYLLQSSIISYTDEISWAEKIKKELPGKKVGFFGGMSTANPGLYLGHADFVIKGEIENCLIASQVGDFSGLVDAGFVRDLDCLPFPDWSYLNKWPRYSRRLGRKHGRAIPVLASRGCPMSCRYYCTYPLVQGVKFRTRTPENIIAEIKYLIANFAMDSVLFRDPIFTLDMERIDKLCDLLIQENLPFTWVCETHPRFLDRSLVEKMARAGCTAIKIGVESGNKDVLSKSLRATAEFTHQAEIIRICEENNIDILAFYILGYFSDTEETIDQTIEYAISLNTLGAQFTIATPYPGTSWYKELQQNNDLYMLDPDLTRYNQYALVYRHPNLPIKQMNSLKEKAYRSYYYRWEYIDKHIIGALHHR